jgi:hypothetical protein
MKPEESKWCAQFYCRSGTLALELCVQQDFRKMFFARRKFLELVGWWVGCTVCVVGVVAQFSLSFTFLVATEQTRLGSKTSLCDALDGGSFWDRSH